MFFFYEYIRKLKAQCMDIRRNNSPKDFLTFFYLFPALENVLDFENSFTVIDGLHNVQTMVVVSTFNLFFFLKI